MTGEIWLTGTITIPADRQTELLPLLEEHIRLTHEEPGCLEFDVTQDATQREMFNLRERFESPVAFDFHQTRTRKSPWGAASVGLDRNFTKTQV